MALHKAERLADPGAELLDRATTMWDRYGRVVLGVVGAVVAIALITFFVGRSKRLSEDQAANRLAEANLMFWQGDYARSLQLSKEIATQYPGTPSGIDAHRLVGESAYWSGDFKQAVAEFKTYLEHQKSGELSDAAHRSLAYALESNHQNAEATQEYLTLVGKFDRESSAEFLMGAARAELAMNKKSEAIQHLLRVVNEFGETTFANRARIELGELGAPAP